MTSTSTIKPLSTKANDPEVLDLQGGPWTFLGYVGGQRAKYKGMCAGPDGKLYCAPYHASRVLIIDPPSGALSVMDGVGQEPDKYNSICAGPDGKLYCAP